MSERGELYSLADVRTLLLNYDARHVVSCPQRAQNYWRMRPEYGPGGTFSMEKARPDKPCTCGLDQTLGKHDDRAQG